MIWLVLANFNELLLSEFIHIGLKFTFQLELMDLESWEELYYISYI